MSLRLQSVQVATGSPDQDGQLVFHNGLLTVVLVRLSDLHDNETGRWFLEVGFGPVGAANSPAFTDLDEAQSWIENRLTHPA